MLVEIYGADWCTFCKDAVKLCESKSIEYKYIDVDDTANRVSLEERMGEKVRTVPQIFVDDKFLPGGYSGLTKELASS
jgi:glutaredoxin 3